MKVSGFTFLRNARNNGYPFIESICSLLPIVDEFICVIGQSEDSTLEEVQNINDPKIKIIQSAWNEKMTDRGFVYGQQKMIAQYNCTGDWAFYLEGDEVLHEEELETIYGCMKKNLDDVDVEALYFNFYHFYGTSEQIGIAGYRQAPRIIRNTLRTIAPDGLFWLVLEKNKRGRYPRAIYSGGNIYHYGHCRKICKMANKLGQVGKYWGANHPTFSTYGHIDTAELRMFTKTHPAIMSKWIAEEAETEFEQIPEYKLSKKDRRNRLRFWLEKFLNVEISKKHFKALD
jgi:glycosyltransferase involved in cell wall biosynthesis